MTIVTVNAPGATPAPASTPPSPEISSVILNGRVYDAGLGPYRRLSDATIEWQFTAPDWQAYNGQLHVPADGLYRLQLPVRADDNLIITARAPGFLPSTAHLRGEQLSVYGSRLNFGLVGANGPAPTLPADLGAVSLHGSVYNSARGVQAPIVNATVTIVNTSVVQPTTIVNLKTDDSGTFSVTLELHTADEVELTISAGNFVTGTLTRDAQDLLKSPPMAIGLQPVP